MNHQFAKFSLPPNCVVILYMVCILVAVVGKKISMSLCVLVIGQKRSDQGMTKECQTITLILTLI